PHDHLGKSDFTGGRMKPGPAKAEWRANDTAMFTCGSKNSVFAAPELIHDLAAGEKNKALMVVGVIPNGVICATNVRCQSGILLDVLTKNEEGCRNAVLVQKREQLWSGTRVRPVIKSKSAALPGIAYSRPK